MQVHGPGEVHAHTQSSGDVAFTLLPGSYDSFRFHLPSHEDAKFKGRFFIRGQGVNGIEVFVVNEQDYRSWQKGYITYRYYETENVNEGAMEIPLLESSGGPYYVVFNNKSPVAAETVRANMSVAYHTLWFAGMEN